MDLARMAAVVNAERFEPSLACGGLGLGLGALGDRRRDQLAGDDFNVLEGCVYSIPRGT
jgi:hypothetical protein